MLREEEAGTGRGSALLPLGLGNVDGGLGGDSTSSKAYTCSPERAVLS